MCDGGVIIFILLCCLICDTKNGKMLLNEDFRKQCFVQSSHITGQDFTTMENVDIRD